MSPKRSSARVERTVALCYVRQSYTRDDDDKNSPERQRANIQAFVERKGWVPEWYEDVGGHKSARNEQGRPEWLRLKARLGDPDVVAVVANDLSRLHRKGWRVGDLVDYLEKRGLALVLAAPGREVDTSTPMGRLFIQFTAIIDEYYSEDISQRAKDSVRYRKERGISIGRPPFGTVRGKDGFLQPSPEGAWLLSSGRFVAGTADERPEDGALWRGYYDCAHYILRMYVEDDIGLEKIAYRLNDEGWAFRDRKGKPRPVKQDDVRRVVANWPEYGGLVFDRKAKDRPAYEEVDVDAIPFVRERAVFPLDLLRAVARLRNRRSMRPIDHGVVPKSHPYPLAGITCCAYCARLAKEQNDPRLITRLGGTNMNGTLRYRHAGGVSCGCTNKSVPCEKLDADFGRLIRLLTVSEEAQQLLTQLAIEADIAQKQAAGGVDLETQKQEAIALCKRRIEAAIHLYSDGLIDREEFLRRREANEREIAHWEARTSETEKVALELAMCIEAVDKLAYIWETSDDEDRQGFVRNLFDYVEYDLDARRITDFRLKPWADRFVILRGALYEAEKLEGEGKKRTCFTG